MKISQLLIIASEPRENLSTDQNSLKKRNVRTDIKMWRHKDTVPS